MHFSSTEPLIMSRGYEWDFYYRFPPLPPSPSVERSREVPQVPTDLQLPGNWIACSNSQPERTLSVSTKILQENDQKMEQFNEHSIFLYNSIRDEVGSLCLKPRPLFEEDIWVHLSWMNPITLLTNSKEVCFVFFLAFPCDPLFIFKTVFKISLWTRHIEEN